MLSPRNRGLGDAEHHTVDFAAERRPDDGVAALPTSGHIGIFSPIGYRSAFGAAHERAGMPSKLYVRAYRCYICVAMRSDG